MGGLPGDGAEAGGSPLASRNGSPVSGYGVGLAAWEGPVVGALHEDIAEPQHLSPGRFQPRQNEESSILSRQQVAALAQALPARHRLSQWSLLYSTVRHGISLQTMYRKGAGVAPTVLVVRDTGGYVFGCYAPEAWRIAPRYYGTGETFVFQLQVRQDTALLRRG